MLLKDHMTVKDRRTIWHSQPPVDAPTRVIDEEFIERSRPPEDVADCIEPHNLFSSILPSDLISNHIVDKAKVKMAVLYSIVVSSSHLSYQQYALI